MIVVSSYSSFGHICLSCFGLKFICIYLESAYPNMLGAYANY